ncbi:MAG: P-loop NTPase [Christensenellales bacterium]|jgi:Mrp family chromosome partitioning ATPase
MSENCTHDCSTCSEACASRQQPQDFRAEENKFSHVKKVVAVVSGKGGVGKSTVTSMLSVIARRRRLKTAILDADITGPSIPKAFGLKEKATGTEDGIFPARTKTGIEVMSLTLLLENDTDPVVWRGPVLGGAVKQFWTDVMWGDIDIMFIDMPPGTGDVPLTVFQSLPVDGIIVVTTPQELVSVIVDKAIGMARLMDIPVLGLVENMSYMECPDCGKRLYPFGEGRVEETAKRHSIQTVATIPIDSGLTLGCDRGLIELFEGDWLEEMVDMVEKLPGRE